MEVATTKSQQIEVKKMRSSHEVDATA